MENSKGRSKDDDATPSNQIIVSQVTLSEISTKISTLYDQQGATNIRFDTLDDDTRLCTDGRTGSGESSDCHRDDAYRGIARGGMPRRNDRRSQSEYP